MIDGLLAAVPFAAQGPLDLPRLSGRRGNTFRFITGKELLLGGEQLSTKMRFNLDRWFGSSDEIVRIVMIILYL